MKGVYKDKIHGGWIAIYGNEYKKHFQTEKLAKKQRREWENDFGELHMGPQPKYYAGVRSGNLKVVGPTGNKKNHSQELLTRNMKTGKLETYAATNIVSQSVKGNRGINKKQRNSTTGYPGVQLIKQGRYKGCYKGCVKINKHSYVTPYFESPKEAFQAKQKIIDNYYQKGKLPDPQKAKTNSGHKYISKIIRKGRQPRWVCDMRIKGNRYLFYGKSLDESLNSRNEILNTHNLPIPD